MDLFMTAHQLQAAVPYYHHFLSYNRVTFKSNILAIH
jgi:hypothetical protein